MATRDSSTEKGYAAEGARPSKKMKAVDLAFRFLAFASTLSAFVVMISDRQSYRPVPGVKLWAKYHYSDAFMWFVVANGIAFGYTFLSFLFGVFNYSPKITRSILILDLMVAFMIMSAASAATAIAYIGKNGLSESRWAPLCGMFDRYCYHVLGALIASFLGWVNLTIIVILGLHRKY